MGTRLSPGRPSGTLPGPSRRGRMGKMKGWAPLEWVFPSKFKKSIFLIILYKNQWGHVLKYPIVESPRPYFLFSKQLSITSHNGDT